MSNIVGRNLSSEMTSYNLKIILFFIILMLRLFYSKWQKKVGILPSNYAWKNVLKHILLFFSYENSQKNYFYNILKGKKSTTNLLHFTF